MQIGTRREIDFTGMTLDGNVLPVVYVESKIIWKSEDPMFRRVIGEIENQRKPGFFLTPRATGDETVRARWHLNRHCVWKSEQVRDSRGVLYRDIDAKGVGYTRGFPIKVLSVREPEMSGDMEMRGILHNSVATDDQLNSEEMAELGVRLARHVAHVELIELVDAEGEIVPRQRIGTELGLNFESVRPTIAFRAMGTTSRVQDLWEHSPQSMRGYAREIVNDAITLVSQETGLELSPKEYVAWFAETLGKQIAKLHRNLIWTDASCQIHRGEHNVTLDCRLTDTARYQTPQSMRREYESFVRTVEREPKLAWMLEQRFPKNPDIGEVEKHNAQGESIDKETNREIAESLARGVNVVYPIGNLVSEVKGKFEKAYDAEK